MASIEFQVGVKRRVPLLLWGRVARRPEMTLEAQSLACGTLSSLKDNLKMASRGRNM